MKHWWDYINGEVSPASVAEAMRKYCISTKTSLHHNKMLFDKDNIEFFEKACQRNGLVREGYTDHQCIEKNTKPHTWCNTYFNTHTYLNISTETIDKSISIKFEIERFNKENEYYNKKYKGVEKIQPVQPISVPEISNLLDVEIISINNSICDRIKESYKKMLNMRNALE